MTGGEPTDTETSDAAIAGPATTLLLRLGLGIFLTLNIMVASWLSYAQDVFGAAAQAAPGDHLLGGVFSYLALFLCTAVVALLGVPLASAAWRLPTHLLILIGVVSAYTVSVIHTLRGSGSLYFDTAALVLVAVTLGSHVEASAKRRAGVSACRLLSVLPRRVRRQAGLEGTSDESGETDVELDEVVAGDVLRFLPGDVIAVDGLVVRGASRLDTSSLSGESRPRGVAPGDRVLAGSINLEGQLHVRCESPAGETVLAGMEHWLTRARAYKPSVQRLADRFSRVFVPSVVLLACSVAVFHVWQGRAAQGLLDGLSVLLISCPCALGLAAPLATWQGLRRAAEAGILIDSPATLEQAALIDRLFFDKTGTLTRPRLMLDSLEVASGVGVNDALLWATQLELSSRHPIARAVVVAARQHGLTPSPATEAAQEAGLGIAGEVLADGIRRRLFLGGWRMLQARKLSRHPLASDDASCVFLMDSQRVLARFELREELRPEARQAVAQLVRLGVKLTILSGDRTLSTRSVASALGLTSHGDLLPEDKLQYLLDQRRDNGQSLIDGTLAMVGDGLNDGPILAAADVGITLGSATDLAQASGNVHVTSDGLDRIPYLLRLARHVRWRIRANLALAFSFNTVGIGLAAAGHLTPVVAAVAMVLSSVTVVRLSLGAGDLSAASQSDGESAGETWMAPSRGSESSKQTLVWEQPNA